MTRFMILFSATLTCLVLPLTAETPDELQQEVSQLLAEQQRALAESDAKGYFANLADDVIIMGTASAERFELVEYRAWSAPAFARAPRPIATVVEENITVSDHGRFAWFDGRIRRDGLGELRLSGVLRRSEDRWKFVQINHSFLVPNEIVTALVEHIQNINPIEKDAPQENDPQGDSSPAKKPPADDVLAVKTVLTDFHRAGADADGDGYFKHLADEAVVLGTAAGERWMKSAYRPRIEPIFERNGGWRAKPIEQNVYLATDGRHAWFDELLIVEGVVELRGSGVVRRERGTWKIVHFNSTIVIPNEVVREFMRLRDKTLTAEAVAEQLLSGGERPVTPDSGAVDLSPTAWPKTEFAELIEKSRSWGRPRPAVSGKAGMVTGTTQVLAVRAGVEALRRGGTAMDAACVAALTQIALNAGATVSYAGIMTVVYYEAKSGNVYTLMAPYATPLGEDSPLTIPKPGTASGRTALVPGFMKGIESAHRVFGKLPFASLFGPAIFFAEQGIVIEGPIEIWIRKKTEVLSRLPATRAVFVNEKGEFAPHGGLLRQRALAATLRRVAAEGAAHMYTGDWARDFVNAVKADGGKISVEDLARYEVVWSDPLRTMYGDREICTVAYPLIGGRMLLESLNLLELADPARYGHYSESAESCYWLIQCARMARLMRDFPEPVLKGLIPGAAFDAEYRLSKENARRIWEKMREPNFMRLLQGRTPMVDHGHDKSGGHSDGIVAVDAAGNIAAMLHTINTVTWGTTGLFVNGVSIPDSAAYMQLRMTQAGPGGYVPNEMNPSIALAGGKPVLASSAVGVGLHGATIGCMHNIFDFDMNPQEALQAPVLMTPYSPQGSSRGFLPFKQAMQAGRYPDELLKGLQALGQDIHELEPVQASGFRGYWIGIAIDPTTGERIGAADSSFNGATLTED